MFILILFSAKFRAVLNWQADCFFVVNDHFFTYQKAGTHSMKCNIECEAPTVIGNSNSKQWLKFDKVPYSLLACVSNLSSELFSPCSGLQAWLIKKI